MHRGGETTGCTPAFECVGLGMSYTLPGRTVEALQGISLRQDPGAFVCIVGPSGCGKTTLLKLLAGLLRPTAGVIRFPAATPGGQPRTALVFQDHGLFPWMTVLDNVAFHLEAMGVGRQERRGRGTELLSTLGVASFADLYPRVLSAGMRQRAGRARALLTDRLLVLSGRRGKVMAHFAVPLPRPRTHADTQRPEEAALIKQVWAMVEEHARYSLRALL